MHRILLHGVHPLTVPLDERGYTFSRMPIHFEYHSIPVKTLANIVPFAGQLTLLPEQGIGITHSLLRSTKFRCLPRDPHWGCFCDPHWLGNRIPFGILPQVRVIDGLSALHRQSARHPLNVGFSLASFAHGLLVSQPFMNCQNGPVNSSRQQRRPR